ncbi:metal-dependent hydrolase [Candidatus Bathyarchaeota archaeon]|nr:metal-dependent hydrolase [Candidatus Bathyarchaeota archaeon]MBS7630048.1 metal-dependent hydrolase [Candidatus Bathyarchaeota archaeon]
MYPLGHVSLAYLLSYLISKYTGEKTNFLLILIFSLAPDLDLILTIEHRGPTHSILLALFILVPIISVYSRGWTLLASLLSHSIIGDYLTSYGCKLLWPLSNAWFRADFIPNSLVLELVFEITLASVMVLLKWREVELAKCPSEVTSRLEA